MNSPDIDQIDGTLGWPGDFLNDIQKIARLAGCYNFKQMLPIARTVYEKLQIFKGHNA